MHLARVKELGSAKERIEQIASGKFGSYFLLLLTRGLSLRCEVPSNASGTLPYALVSLFYSLCETLQGQSKVKKSLLASFRRTSLSHGSLQNQTA
jgi:hypothetical protein